MDIDDLMQEEPQEVTLMRYWLKECPKCHGDLREDITGDDLQHIRVRQAWLHPIGELLALGSPPRRAGRQCGQGAQHQPGIGSRRTR